MRGTDVWGKGPERLADGLEPYPLAAHLMDTAAVCQALWDSWLSPRLRRLLADELCEGDEEAARGWAATAAGMHDVGKATPVFQEQAGSTRPGVERWRPIVSDRLEAAGLPRCTSRAVQALRSPGGAIARRHEYLGLAALIDRDPGELRRLQLGDDWLAAVVGGHHGRWRLPARDDVAPSLAAGMRSGKWGELQRRLCEEVATACGRDLALTPRLDPSRAGVVVILLTGLTILADWVASSDGVVEGGYRRIAQGDDPESPTWLQRRADELNTVVGSSIGSYVPSCGSRATVFGAAAGRVPRPLQVDAEAVGEGAWFVAYPTGEGKTEAALLRHMAGAAEGLVFGLPTRATTTAMQARLASVFAGTGNTVLLSHQYAAAHHVECASEYGLEWYSSSIRRLVAPVVAATCDQVLVGALRQHHAALRLLALANHHIVLDEVHTYDQYQSQLLTSLLAWWGATGTRVTLLSATMPRWQRRAFASAYLRGEAPDTVEAPYPAHWTVDQDVQPVHCPPLSAPRPDLTLEVTSSDDATGAHVSWAAAAARRHPACRIAVIRSTVDDAARTARRLRGLLAGVPVMCLHSRMTASHRARLEADMIDRLGPASATGGPLVVVATQVIEASLDIDFDLMSTDLAPAASLIQRAGRLWRSSDDAGRAARLGAVPDRRVMRVIARTRRGQIAGRVSLPYFDSELARVSAWLSHTSRLRVPEDVQRFVDETTLDLEHAPAGLSDAEEIAAASRRIEAATLSRNDLQGRVAGRTARPRYPDLVFLSGGEDEGFSLADEDRMGTRFEDLTSGTYLLVGGSVGAPASVGVLRHTRDGELLRACLGATLPVSGGRLCGILDEAARQTAPDGWEPDSRLLSFTRPVHASLLAEAGLVYDEHLGLVDSAILDEETQS